MDNSMQKKVFLDAYAKSYGNITKSCKAADIARQTYYNWLDNDPEFSEQVNSIEPAEQFLDFLETKLVERINEGDTTAVIFALKTKGKKRGYIEKTEVENTGNMSISWHEEKTYNTK